MTKRRHALTRRKEWTCSECWYCHIRDGRPWCEYYGDYNRWNVFEFGCGVFGCTNSGEVEIPITLACYGVRF